MLDSFHLHLIIENIKPNIILSIQENNHSFINLFNPIISMDYLVAERFFDFSKLH